jgi:hypothetical protein
MIGLSVQESIRPGAPLTPASKLLRNILPYESHRAVESDTLVPMNMTVYSFIYSRVDETPGVRGKSLKRMVGASGFEPPTSWSRTRFQALLESMEFCGF